MGKFAAVVNSLYVLAGIALFTTGEAPVITPGTDFLGNSHVKAWAGWKFSGCLYMALVNWGVSLKIAAAVTMIPYIVFDIHALNDSATWTGFCASFILTEALTAIAALMGNLKVGGVVNALYVLAGIALFTTGEAPVMNAKVDFLGDKFAMAWAGWKFSGCLYFAMLNLGAHNGLSMFVAMMLYVGWDLFALNDPTHWTSLAGSFIVLDGAMGLLGLQEYLSSIQGKKEE